MCLNARSIVNKKNELNIMVDDIKPHIIGIIESWANKQNNEKIHNAISEVSKGDCIIMGDFNHGNIK